MTPQDGRFQDRRSTPTRCEPKKVFLKILRGVLAQCTAQAYSAFLMIFSKKNAGKWVASKDDKVVATDKNLSALRKKMAARKYEDAIGYTLVPPHLYLVGSYGISVR